MNDKTSGSDLPALSDEAIARIEDAVFAEIASERAPARPPRPSPVLVGGGGSPAAASPRPSWSACL